MIKSFKCKECFGEGIVSWSYYQTNFSMHDGYKYDYPKPYEEGCDNTVDVICPYCDGTGKIDWVRNAIVKKHPFLWTLKITQLPKKLGLK